MMRGHCGDNGCSLSSIVSEMMPLRASLCQKQSHTQRIKWMPSVSPCLHLEQLKTETCHSRSAAGRELLMAFRSVWTALCQCCACEPPSSANWSKHSALLIAFGCSFWICAWVCCVLPSLPWQRQTNISAESFQTHTFWFFLADTTVRNSVSDSLSVISGFLPCLCSQVYIALIK